MLCFLRQNHIRYIHNLNLQSYITAKMDKTICNNLKTISVSSCCTICRENQYFLSNCPLKDRLRDLIKNASKIFRFFGYSSALVLSSQIDDQEGCNYLFGSSSSTHLRTTYLIDSPIQFSPHEQLITFVKNAVVCLILFEI